MPLAYTGPSGILTHVGKLIARQDSYDALADTTLAADLLTLVTAFGTTWLPPEGIASFYRGLQDNVTGWRQDISRFCDNRLLDSDTVLTQLDAPLDPASGLAQLLPALVRQMLLDGETVRACSCTAGPVTALTDNTGDGTAFVTLTLDGFNAPVLGGQANVEYDGWQSQMCAPSETMTLECVADSAMDGLSAGDERWTWTGGVAFATLDWRDEGSGSGPTITTDNGGTNLLSNAGFSQWSGGSPAGWTFTGGVQDGTAAKFTGNGSLSFAPASGRLDSRRRYRLGVLVKQSGATTGTITLAMSTGESVTIAAADAGASYGHLSAFLTMPAPVPSGFAYTLTLAGMSGGSVWVTAPSLVPTTYHGGVGVNVAAGVTPFQRGDRLTFPVTNDLAGKFQNFWRRWYRTQLPSVSATTQGTFLLLPFLLLSSSGVETIPDALVA